MKPPHAHPRPAAGARSFACRVVSVEDLLFDGPLRLLVARGTLGELGIMAGHTPLLSALQPGPMELLHADGTRSVMYVSGGFLEVQPLQVTVLADTIERAEALDAAAAEHAHQHALAELRAHPQGVDLLRIEIELQRALAQLETLRRLHGQARH